MALDREELRRRRQEREEERKRRRAKKRKLILLLAAAAGVIAVIVLVLLSMQGNTPQPQQTLPTATDPFLTDPETTNPFPTLPQQEPTTVIHIAAAGDLNITDAVVQSGGGTYDYYQTFWDVSHLLADADISVLNFEGVLAGTPYGSSTRSAPQSMVEALAEMGVDLIQLANSYPINRGMLGLSDTIQRIKATGMEPLGAYASQAEYAMGKGYTICQVQGVKVGFVAFTKGMDGMTLPAGNENCVNVLYNDYDSTYQSINRSKINAVLDALEKENPDVTIALLHWGSEFNDTISSSQETILSIFRNRGVDAVIGTHSHYVQKMEFDPLTGFFAAYSLGDFVGDANRAGSEYSVILDLEITKDNNTGTAQITNYSYTPIFTVVEKGKPLRVVRLETAMAAWEAAYINCVPEEVYKAMVYAHERVEARVAGE